MSSLQKIKNTPLIEEFRQNTRLQWLLLLVFIILMLSVTKRFSDFVNEAEAERETQFSLFQRVLAAANQPLDENSVEKAEALYQNAFANLPTAVSDSVAQAQALKRMEQITTNRISRSRVSLVSSDRISFGRKSGWQIRLNVAGQMPEKALINFLSETSGNHADTRLLSLQYNPKVSNTISFVVDFVYVEEQRNEL